jgi:hypothetical protein
MIKNILYYITNQKYQIGNIDTSEITVQLATSVILINRRALAQCIFFFCVCWQPHVLEVILSFSHGWQIRLNSYSCLTTS